MPAVIIPIEIAHRELLYKTQLAARLAERGFHCYLTTKAQVLTLLEMLSPCIYMDKGYHQGVSEKIHSAVKKNNGIIVSLDEEGAVDFEGFPTLDCRYPEYLFETSDLVFMWGRAQYEHFKSIRKSFHKERVVVSGHPRFDSLKQKAAKNFEDLAGEIKRREGRFVLLNLNSGFGNNLKGDDFARKNYGPRVKELEKIMRYDQVKIKKYVELAKAICEQTAYIVIIRPHPEEAIEPYEKQLAELGLDKNKCRVDMNHSVLPWLMACEFIVHPDCTTAVEAYLIDKQPISYLPEDPSRHHTWLPVKASLLFSKAEQVIECIKSGPQECQIDAAQAIENFLSISQDSLKIITDEIFSRFFKLSDRDKKLTVRQEIILRARFVLQKLKQKIVFSLTASKEHQWARQKNSGLEIKLVRKYLDSLNLPDVSAKALADQIVCVRRT